MRSIYVVAILSLVLILGCVTTRKKDSQVQKSDYYITKHEFKDMVRTGLPESTIKKRLVKNKKGYKLSPQEIVDLREWGASNELIWLAIKPPKKAKSRKVKKREEAPKSKKVKTKPSEGDSDKARGTEGAERKTTKETDSSDQDDTTGEKKSQKNNKKKYPSLFYYGYDDDEKDPIKKKDEKD